MGSLTSLDGTFEKTLTSATDISGLPTIIQKYMAAGVSSNKLTFTKLFDESSIEKTGGLENVVAQLSVLDEKQQQAFINLSDFNGELKKTIQNLLLATKQGEKFNSKLFEQEASKDDKLSKGVLNEVMQTTGMKDADGNYLLTNTKDVCDLLEQYANDADNAQKAQELFNAGLLEQSDNGYKVSASLLKLIGAKKSDIVTTGIATAGQMAWNYAMQIGKQLLLSFGVAAVTFIATKLVDYIMNLKTRSEELVDAMNDSHDAAQQATKDVEEIQSKIDELNKSLKDAGVDKIEDIVDPAERERLQAINDMLQAQLELKKQLEKDAADKANADTSAVVNDKTEDSIVKTRTVNVSYAEDGVNAGTHQVAEKVSKTESLNEHSDYLDKLVQKRREMAEAGEEETQAYKDNEAEIEKEKKKVGELSSAVSEQADKYETDVDNFDQYKDEYVGCTDAIKAAAAAIKNANDGLDVDTTNLDVLKKKIQDIQEQIANGDGKVKGTNRNDYGYLNAVDTLKSSGVTTGEDILNLASNRSSQTDEQSKAIATLRKEAKDAKVSLAEYISVLEQTGEISTKVASKTRGLSDAMTTLDNMQSGYQACASAVDEYNKKGYVTMDTLQSLINLEPKYLKMLELKDGQLKINTQTAQTLTDANIQLARASLLADTLNNIKDTNNLKKAQSILGSVTEVVESATGALIGAQHQAASEAFESEGFESYATVMDATSTMISNYETLDALFVKLGKQNPSKIWGKDSSATNKASKQASSALDAWSTLSSAMEEYNKQGSISLNTMKSLMGLEEKYTACLKKQGNELTIDATKFRNMIQAELAVAAATEDASDKTKAKVAQYTQILQYLDENAKEGTISLNELRDAIEGVGASLDKAQEKTSGLKSTFGTIHDILNTDNPAGALTSDNVESVIDLIQEHSELKDILYDENGSLVINEKSLKTATIALLENEKAATKDVAIQAILQKSIDDLSNGIISITDYLKGLNTELDDIDSKLDKFQSGFSDITNIVTEYNTYGKLTQDSYQKLLRLDPQYLECLEKEGNQLKFNAAQYRMLYAEQVNQLAITAKSQTQRDVYTSVLADIFGFTPDQVEQYKSAINEYSDTVQKFRDQGVDKYGNIDNLNRDIIEWTSENLAKYHDFVKEQNTINPGEIEEGGYSTVLGADENIDGIQIAFTPMLQTENGAVPLTKDQLWNYLDTIIEAAYGESDTLDIDKLLALDAEGLDENINGVVLRVKGMIAAIQGMLLNGEKLTAADVSAIAG